MTDREIALATLALIVIVLLAGADFLWEYAKPNEDLIDAATVALALVAGYKAGKAAP